ncbi:hypothetical protein E4U55_001495 [Claviceps digitariae]|nr:hypothetical protein E4U55_001495 [Claviceps digitariae]
MAPLPPSTSTSARALRSQRLTGQIHPLLPSKIYRPDAHVTDDFLSTKRDKRLMKHSSFVSRISAPSGITKSKSKSSGRSTSSTAGSAPRRRRPNNKLKTSLEGLAEALPEMEHGEGGLEILAGKVRQRSLVSKKGALRRKERLVRGEMERFGASMAALAAGMGGGESGARDAGSSGGEVAGDGGSTKSGQASSVPATANRWAALRGYISSTMEQNPAFSGR